MAICNVCNQDMCTAKGCIYTPITIDGEEYDPIKYGDPGDFGEGLHEDNVCHDCGCKVGEYHHSGCDFEQCPKCGGQLISCGCLGGEDDE